MSDHEQSAAPMPVSFMWKVIRSIKGLKDKISDRCKQFYSHVALSYSLASSQLHVKVGYFNH